MDNEIQLTQMNGSRFLDSRDVAKMIDKKHKNLIRDIEKFISDISTGSNLSPLNFFVESSYKDAKGEKRKCYLVTKQGCEVLANKMTGKKGNQFTARYVDLFNKMETRNLIPVQFNIPRTLPEALRLAADQAEQLERQKPKVAYYENMLRNPGLMTMTEIAKNYGWSAHKMNEFLASKGVQFKQGKHWVLKQKYAGEGYAQYEPYPFKDNKGVHNNLKWTSKGQQFIYDLLASDGIYPILEQQALDL